MKLNEVPLNPKIETLLSRFRYGCHVYFTNNTNNNMHFEMMYKPNDDSILISSNYTYIEIKQKKIYSMLRITGNHEKISYKSNDEINIKEINEMQEYVLEGKEYFDEYDFNHEYYLENVEKELNNTYKMEDWYTKEDNIISIDYKNESFYENQHMNRIIYITALEKQQKETPTTFWKCD